MDSGVFFKIFRRGRIGEPEGKRKRPGRSLNVRAAVFNQDLRLLQQQARFPADAFGRCAELFEGAVLNLADALFADAEQVADLAEAVGAGAGQAEAEVEEC